MKPPAREENVYMFSCSLITSQKGRKAKTRQESNREILDVCRVSLVTISIHTLDSCREEHCQKGQGRNGISHPF